MSKQQEMHYKDSLPEKTISQLKEILNKRGVSVDEIWNKESSIGTYSVRVNFKGTSIGANGKGVTKSYALASGYAELFERLQNGLLGAEYLEDKFFSYVRSYDEKCQTIGEILSQNSVFMKFYFKSLGMEKISDMEKAEFFLKENRMDYYIFNENDKYITIPFYNVREDKIEYLPFYVYHPLYTSNGMCAGNTKEEALVQGLAEIIERYVMKKIMIEKPALPDVPDDYIHKYPRIYELLKKTREMAGYNIFVKDCSFGGKYPVVAAVIIEKNTGKYGFKLGCHPDFGVALERVFTEMTQGSDIDQYATRSCLDFDNKGVESSKNIFNGYKVGMAQYPYQILCDNYSYDFQPIKDVSGLNNKEILQFWLKDIMDEGYDVLIRDVSILGFPSFHIIIPGMSEINDVDLKVTHALQTRCYVSRIMRDPKKINIDNCKYVKATYSYFLGDILENSVKSFYNCQYVKDTDIPLEGIGCGSLYIICMSNVMLGQYGEAAVCMRKIIEIGKNKMNSNQIHFYIGAKYYFEGMKKMGEHEEVMKYLGTFFSEKICCAISELFEDSSKVFVKQYPNIKEIIKQHTLNNDGRFLGKLLGTDQIHKIDQKSVKSILA